MADRTQKELKELRAGYKKHIYDPHAGEETREGRKPVSFKAAFDEFLRTLDAAPHSRPSWYAAEPAPAPPVS